VEPVEPPFSGSLLWVTQAPGASVNENTNLVNPGGCAQFIAEDN